MGAPHIVCLDLRCDCPAHITIRNCKHVLAVRLHRGDPHAVRAADG